MSIAGRTAAGAFLTLALAACGSDDGDSGGDGGSGSSAADLGTIEEGSLTVCSDIPYPPFDVMEGDTFTGFDGDLINEIAEIFWKTEKSKASGVYPPNA